MTHDTTSDTIAPGRGRNGTLWGIADCCVFPCRFGCEFGEHAYCLWDCEDAPEAPPGECQCGFCAHQRDRDAGQAAKIAAMQRAEDEWRLKFPLLAALWDWTAQAATDEAEWNRRKNITMAQTAADLEAAIARREAAEQATLNGACEILGQRVRARGKRIGL